MCSTITGTRYKEFHLLVKSENYILLHLKLFDRPLTIMHAHQPKRKLQY